MITAILILSVVFDVVLVLWLVKSEKGLRFWRVQQQRAAQQYVSEYQRREIYQGLAKKMTVLFWFAWFLALLLWLKLRARE